MTQFAIAFSGRELADVAAEALASDGYATELQESGLDWVVAATKPTSARETTEAEARMSEVARIFGSDYLGHGGLTSWGIAPE